MAEMNAPVRPYMRAVANGREGNILRATLVATPEPAPDGQGTGRFEFSEWPERMAGLVAAQGFVIGLHVRRAEPGAMPPVEQWRVVKAHARRLEQVPAQHWRSVQAQWKGAFERTAPDPWRALLEDIGRSLKAKKHKADLNAPVAPIGKDSFDRDGAILMDPPQAGTQALIRGVVPIAQGAKAIEIETVRAARVLAKLGKGPARFQDDKPALETPLPEQPLPKDDGRLEDAHYDDYTSTFYWAAEARAGSRTHFSAVTSALDGSKSEQVSGPGRAKPGLVPDPGLVKHGNPACTMTASHTYGTWLQRSQNYKWNGDKPPTVPDHETAAANAPPPDRIRAIYYAIQGDPALSRLFCLAIDLEIDVTDPANRWLGTETELRLHIAADPAGAATRPPVAATAALLTKESFWPYSVFEKGLSKRADGTYGQVDQAGLVEQRNGMWLLGQASGAAGAPRHDLVSLDIRRAMNGQSESRDRGERHASAGFTIMDHDRASQIARDMALSAMHAPTVAPASPPAQRELVLLHADELTIGRRIDVAAVAPGTDIHTFGGWRSLMQRLVTFDFGKLQDALVPAMAALLGEHRRTAGFLDENSFQTGARYMPLPGGNLSEAPCEVVAEEAIFLWDGTPAAVLTSGRDDGPRASDGDLPFSRMFRLPDAARHGELRPPPLRYGVPYAFSARAVFLGGGSPDPAAIATNAARTADTMLPPAIAGMAAPRRFLRHDGIAAPSLMFAAETAYKLDPVMGFEELDKAIVRSATTPPKGHALAETGPEPGDRPAYPQPPAAERARMALACRVFVAPEAAHDKVVRHGMLDTGNAAQVLRGGLLDVDYLPRKEAKPGDLLAGGFPMAVTRKLPSLDGEGAAYTRDAYRNGKDEPTGSPVLRPGRNLAKSPHGYLPDPAIATFCVRAAIRGCGCYLPGHRQADLYPAGFAYPHALPLAFTVRRMQGTRPAPASGIGEISQPAKPARLQADGRVLPGWSGPGIKVQHIEFALMEGEDYDVEVACLPSPHTFARCFALPETIAMQLAAGRVSADEAARLNTLCGTVPDSNAAPAGPPMTGLGGLPAPPLAEILHAAGLVLDTMQSKWPIEEVAAVTRLRVCHAINCPVSPPLLGTADNEFNAIRIRRPLDASKPGDEVGATMLLLQGNVRVDLEQVDAFEVHVTTEAPAGQKLDDRNRGRSLVARRAGRWPRRTGGNGEPADVRRRDVLGMDVDDAGQVTLPRDTVVLLRVENLPTHGARPLVPATGFGSTVGRYTTLDLGQLHAAAITNQPVTFPVGQPPGAEPANSAMHVVKVIQKAVIADTRAREVDLRIVALSRHAAAFETAPFYGGPNKPALHRRLPLPAQEQAAASASLALRMPATERPSPPSARRPEPSFVTERRTLPNNDGGASYTVERRASSRLWLGRNRLTSGAGERVGVVLWPPFYFSALTDADVDRNKVAFEGRAIDIADFQDADLGAAGAFVTRWGGDPVRGDGSPQSGFLIPPSAFQDLDPATRKTNPHHPRIVPRIDMPVQTAEGTEHLQVTLLTYAPLFDLDREEWFVDVDLRPIRAAEPFVRLGLVHYQENAVAGQEVSHPVAVTLPLLPQRSAEVVVSGTADMALTVTVRGLGMLDILDLDPRTALAGDKDVDSFVKAFDTLRKPAASAFVFHETTRPDGTTLRTPLDPLDPASPGLALAVDTKNNVLQWTANTVLEQSRVAPLGPGRIVIYVEETDRRMPANYPTEPILPRDLFDKKHFRNSGPRFSARIPLKELTGGARA